MKVNDRLGARLTLDKFVSFCRAGKRMTTAWHALREHPSRSTPTLQSTWLLPSQWKRSKPASSCAMVEAAPLATPRFYSSPSFQKLIKHRVWGSRTRCKHGVPHINRNCGNPLGVHQPGPARWPRVQLLRSGLHFGRLRSSPPPRWWRRRPLVADRHRGNRNPLRAPQRSGTVKDGIYGN